MKYLIYIIICGTCWSCTKLEDFKSKDLSSKNEVYVIKESISETKLKIIFLDKAQSPKNIGSSLLDGDFLYILEKNRGIHVFDNSNSVNPKNIFFISIPAISDFIIRDNLLICNNGNDIISCDVKLITAIKSGGIDIATANLENYFSVLKRQANVLKFPNFPEARNIYFECPDSAGIVVEWEKKLLETTPNCYR